MGAGLPEAILMLRSAPEDVPAVRRVRGQWIAASLRAVRERGIIAGVMRLLVRAVYVHDVTRARRPPVLSYRVQWV